MRNNLRSLLLGTLALMSAAAMAQHVVHVSGHMTPCDPVVWGNTVTIEAYHNNGEPPVITTTTLNENCWYSTFITVMDTTGYLTVTTSCVNGVTSLDSTGFVAPGNVVLDITCTPPPCEACFTMSQNAPFAATFNSACSVAGTGSPTFIWDFSDAGAVPGTTVSHTYNGPGQYAVCLNLSTGQGCTDQICQQVYVDDQGNVSFSPPSNCQACFTMAIGTSTPWALEFSDCSTGDNLSYNWIFADGSVSAIASPTWNLPQQAGHYAACLQVSNGSCTEMICDSVYVNESGLIGTEPTDCEAGFWVIQAYQNGDTLAEPVPFELWIWNLSSGGTGNFQFTWDFGDGTTSSEPFPTHVYAASGPYTLCLTITDDEGCTDTYCEEISVDDDGFLGMAPGGGEVRSALTVNVLQHLPTSVNEQPALETTNLWPNPVTGQLNLQLHSSRSGRMEVSIINLDGRTMRSSQVALMTGTNLLPMDVTALPAGMYMVRLTDGKNVATMRFVKQ